jgi:hypothetical protein
MVQTGIVGDPGNPGSELGFEAKVRQIGVYPHEDLLTQVIPLGPVKHHTIDNSGDKKPVIHNQLSKRPSVPRKYLVDKRPVIIQFNRLTSPKTIDQQDVDMLHKSTATCNILLPLSVSITWRRQPIE